MKQRTIGILTPLVDGFFYGDMVWGIANGGRAHDIRIIVVRTAYYSISGKRLDFPYSVAWDHVDAWIVIADAVTEEYVAALAKTGKPIITLANEYKQTSTYVVKCDNRGSAAESTKHLIDNGHTRIAFVGDLGNTEFRERFEGYKDTMKQYGLAYEDELLLYNTASGLEAAQAIIANGLPATAIVAAADFIALDMIATFHVKGISMPEDIAIVGFDDIGSARTSTPSLTTVRQPIIDIGVEGIHLLMEILDERVDVPAVTLLPSKLIVRGSTLSGVSENSDNEQTLTWKNFNDDDLEQLIESYHMITVNVFGLTNMSWLRWANQNWGCVARWKGDGNDPVQSLVIDNTFDINEGLLPELGDEYSLEQFPPLSMMPVGFMDGRVNIAIIQLIHVDFNSQGFIVTAGAVDERLLRGYGTRQFGPLIGTKDKYQALLQKVQSREASNAALLEKLEIVSRTTNDGVFELDLSTMHFSWISGIEHITGIPADELPELAVDYIKMVHPDDIICIVHAWERHVEYRKPFGVEFRIMRKSLDYIWVYSAGEALLDGEGKPVRLIGSLTNIHIRKQAETALIASEGKYRDFFINTPVMILSLDDQFVITDANPYWIEAMEYPLDNIIGRSCMEFLSAESKRVWFAEWQGAVSRDSGVVDMELQWVTASGKVIVGLVNCKRFGEADGDRIYLTVRDITERKLAEQQIHELAYQDPLTGLANRRLFYEKLAEAIEAGGENPADIAILVIDLDHFKVINDSIGHDMGDRLLCHVAKVIHSLVDTKGLVARIGGDEFMVMLNDCPHEEAVIDLANRLLKNLQQKFTIEGYDLYVSASIGLSWFPDHGRDITTLIKMADTAMYRAKQQGRNRLAIYMDSLNLEVNDRLTIGNKLRKAVETMYEFCLYYQPQIELETGKLLGVEALIRWIDPERGVIPPDAFIPFAEESGLIVPIGYWVITEACRQLKEWQQKYSIDLLMSINISAKQLQQAEFIGSVDQIIKNTGVKPSQVCFEITETTALQNMEFSQQAVNELVLRGIHMALDDFGTGYSSLSLLEFLPLQTIKIDRSFITRLKSAHENTAIVRAIIAMSRSLNMRTLAEGVETNEQMLLLRDMGCDAYQGYLSSRPIPAEQFEELFLRKVE